MSGTEGVTQPPERLSNRDRRFQPRRTPRLKLPLMTADRVDEGSAVIRGAAVNADLDTSDPTAGGGRGFTYQWEETVEQLHEQILTVASGGGISYTHHQSVPAAQWVIDHHMGLIPNVVILDDSGQQLIAEVHHPSDQTTVIVHSAPYTGTAYLRP